MYDGRTDHPLGGNLWMAIRRTCFVVWREGTNGRMNGGKKQGCQMKFLEFPKLTYFFSPK